MPRCVAPAQCPEFHANPGSIEDLDVFPYHKYLENMQELESLPPLLSMARTETYTDAGAPMGKYIAERLERNAQSFLEITYKTIPTTHLRHVKSANIWSMGARRRA